ncbi:hypothetical protein GCM10009733_036820 [Nonomuraea maheshkhaliensis]|uniref:Uncharacterized protein n=1 Tax=Nonomuraea maheshkhaliensis TaxID=419590 RepID=A0ABN2F9F7_9ACTN
MGADWLPHRGHGSAGNPMEWDSRMEARRAEGLNHRFTSDAVGIGASRLWSMPWEREENGTVLTKSGLTRG